MEVYTNTRNVAVLKTDDGWFDFKLGFNAFFVKDVLFYDNMGINYDSAQAKGRLEGYNSTDEKLICTAHESFLLNLAGKRKKYTFTTKVTSVSSNKTYILEGDGSRHLTFKSLRNASLCNYVIMMDLDNREIDVSSWNAYAHNANKFEESFVKQLERR